ncbi:hypothetical protein ATER59S_00389 [Aquamicrobium terrae]
MERSTPSWSSIYSPVPNTAALRAAANPRPDIVGLSHQGSRRPLSYLRCDRLDDRAWALEYARSPVIYASEHYSTVLLEKLVHGSGRQPPNQHYVEITIPGGLTYEVFSPPALPGWDTMPATDSKAFGEKWCIERRSAIMIVPRVIARLDNNVLINPTHPEFRSITASLHQPVFWDKRLFGA